jgi:spore maturation protein SpmB
MFSSLLKTLFSAWRDGHAVALNIFRFLIPIVIIVKILEESGLIPYLALPMRPVMDLIGLPAELSLAWIPSMLISMYSGLIVLISLVPMLPELTVAQMTVFGVLILIAHSLVLEVRIAGQCGVSMPFQLILRLSSGILAAFILHILFDSCGLFQQKASILLAAKATPTFPLWLLQQIKSLGQMYIIICAVMLLQKFLDSFHISDLMGRLLGPILQVLGISPKAISIVIIGFTMGILYGSGILIKNARNGELSHRDALCSISLLGLSHSLIEDTLLLSLIGGSLWGLLGFRILFTVVIGSLINHFYPLLERFAIAKA